MAWTSPMLFSKSNLRRSKSNLRDFYIGLDYYARAARARRPSVAARTKRRIGGRGHTCLGALPAEYAPTSRPSCRRNTMAPASRCRGALALPSPAGTSAAASHSSFARCAVHIFELRTRPTFEVVLRHKYSALLVSKHSFEDEPRRSAIPVSYTHLTLPTILLV